jgi:hypothetical protein
MKNIVEQLTKEISEKHAEIIDGFVKAYLASRWEDYFGKQKKVDFRRLELVIKQDGMTTTYFCQLRKGKLPPHINK